jgi:hypothetical protein
MSRYLYGASVQGIQDFIFKTNGLQEIVGASEIVKSLEKEFVDFAQISDDDILLNAAGNIKAIFDDRASLEKVVLEFPKLIMQKAYGITISEAAVKMDGKFTDQKEAIKELEKRLKIQRNKPSIPLDLSTNILELAPKTARPLVEKDVDKSTKQKREAYAQWFKNERRDDKDFEKSKELSYISNSKAKLAVIHADGNGLGQLIPTLKNIPEFSRGLNLATTEAYEKAKKLLKNDKIRKIILGGDDMTVICDANYALEFTKVFLEEFEKQTLEKTGYKLTACAGIAFCNEKYPFHYAVSLAEALCSATKKHAKKLVENIDKPAPSSLMFHNIQSSNFQSWEKFVADELTISNDKETIRCDFGPYYLSYDGEPKIENFLNTVEAYRCEGSPISRLRSWLSELSKSSVSAKNMLDRINEMTAQNGKWDSCIMDKNLKQFKPELSNKSLIIDKDGIKKTPIYDVLQILSVTEVKS